MRIATTTMSSVSVKPALWLRRTKRCGIRVTPMATWLCNGSAADSDVLSAS